MIIFSQDTNDISGERLNSSISKIKNVKLLLKIKEDELSRKTLEAKELTAHLYDDKQTIALLEDRLRDLNFRKLNGTIPYYCFIFIWYLPVSNL